MAGLLHRSQTAIADAPRHGPPDSWHDLKRDWQRWSRGERIAAECFLGALLIGGSLVLALTSLP